MSNMKRALMFTAYEFIIRVTPRASGNKLALTGKKQKTIPTLIPRCSGVQAGFTVRNPTWRNFLFFLNVRTNITTGQVRDNTTHLSSYIKSSLSFLLQAFFSEIKDVLKKKFKNKVTGIIKLKESIESLCKVIHKQFWDLPEIQAFFLISLLTKVKPLETKVRIS